MIQILIGDVLEQLATLPDGSVQMVCTSPPFWGLRDYGTARWDGGDDGCDHKTGRFERGGLSSKQASNTGSAGDEAKNICPRCGAIRIDSQIGLEKTPELFVAKMVEVFREVRRVLRDDGTLWLNLGDSYNGYMANQRATSISANNQHARPFFESGYGRRTESLKPKDLVGIPWRVAFALQADGWWLRSEIIWHKKNPMPESVTDRPTKAHEQIFLLAKSERYYFDQDAVREPLTEATISRDKTPRGRSQNGGGSYESMMGYDYDREGLGNMQSNPNGRNIRTVWEIATQPFPDAHFATFPEDIPKRCILAGTSARGCCPNCSAPWERVTERGETDYARLKGDRNWRDLAEAQAHRGHHQGHRTGRHTLTANGTVPSLRAASTTHVGWRATCACGLEQTKPCTVLDPFAGSGTTLKVALELGRQAVGIELNPDYAAMIERRCQTTLGLPL